VNGKLFLYLHDFKQKASGANTIEYKIGEIFGEIKNKIQSGYYMDMKSELKDLGKEFKAKHKPEASPEIKKDHGRER
jgi:type I restriction enzyme M protein